MNRIIKTSLQSLVLAGLTLPTSASAGVLTELGSQCLECLNGATLGQFISLGIMLALVTGIIIMKWKDRPASELPKEMSSRNDSAIHAMKQLKIGSRFSDLRFSRLSGNASINN